MSLLKANDRVSIVTIGWHTRVVDGLIDGARDSLDAASIPYDIHRAPSAFELPLIVSEALGAGWVGAVALGAIIRGHTDHHMYMAQSVSFRLGEISLATRKPIGFGVLTVANEAEALDRAGLAGSKEDRGAEAAQSVVESLALLRTIRLGIATLPRK